MSNDRSRQENQAARPRRAWWYAAIAIALAAIALSNAFSERANYARLGAILPLYEPLAWEFSSVFMIALLLPAVAWLYRRFPLHQARPWYSAALTHVLATVPFSVIHVAGMVGLRKIAYALVGSTYRFGPAWAGWLYEYRKDAVIYALIVLNLAAFNAWRHERNGRATKVEPAIDHSAGPEIATEPADRIVVRKLNREFILDPRDIARLESYGNYVTVYANGTTFQLRAPLSGVARRLDARRFVQVHRRQIVNLDHVREIQPWDHGDYRVLLKDGNVVNFSRRYRAQLEHLFRLTAEGDRRGAARP